MACSCLAADATGDIPGEQAQVQRAYPLTGAAIRRMSGPTRGDPAVDGFPALIVIDMLNPYEHADADALAEQRRGIVDRWRG